MSFKFLFAASLIYTHSVVAQDSDTSKTILLPTLEYHEHSSIGGIEMLPDQKNQVIYAAKKSTLINLEKLNADLSTNSSRQVFGKIAGISIWENDGSGIQQGIAARGLSPNRSWEFNMRQNGFDISSDMFGYPEAYYTPPMEAVESIEIIRGAASLQFGPQFGGLVNYKLKKGNSTQRISFESQQTVGSYGMLNSFNAIGGSIKKFSYYGFVHHRSADGWRNNSEYRTITGYLSGALQLNKKMKIELEYTDMFYKSRQPGGLTDLQFQQNHRQSSRARNWFSAPFKSYAANYNYEISSKILLQLKLFGNIAERNSVGYTKSINIKDSINPLTNDYTARQVDQDRYENYGAELRVTNTFQWLGKYNITAAGLRAYKGNTYRNQSGIGTTGADFNFTMLNPNYGRSLNFQTINYAAFAEHIFYLGNRIKFVPGIRYEFLENQKSGYINTSVAGAITDESRNRNIFLYGAGTEFKVTRLSNLYANYSRAYRPITFSELTPGGTTEIIDPNLKDASGFNADFGYRGQIGKFINFDVSLFYLQYHQRTGIITVNSAPYRTNIGTSASKGVESYIEVDVTKLLGRYNRHTTISFFASNSYINAKYIRWDNPAIADDPLKSIENKKVENAPAFIHRIGTTCNYKKITLMLQYNYTGEVYTDAANTETAPASANIGKLPAYQVIDATFSYRIISGYTIRCGVNNLTNEKYASRRASGYPGPGILPGNARTFFVTFGVKL